MSDKSSFLKYLPPVLWENEPALPAFSLGAMLRIFEKLLTGIDDTVAITHGDHAHEPVQDVLDRLHRLYDPRTTPPEFLDWLASWVALEFPLIWDEYLRRKVTGEMAGIYQLRGLKEGLDQLLELYTIAEKRPRIVIDDGSRILTTRPEPERFAPVHTLISHGPSVRTDPATQNLLLNFEGMVRPTCMARAPDGSVLVGDLGTPAGWSPVVEQRVWRIFPEGRYPFTGVQPEPQPVGPPGAAWNLLSPVAVAVDDQVPWNLYVLDNAILPASPALFRLTSPALAAVTTIATAGQLQTVWPVAMAFDTNGHLLILDRGAPAPAAAPAVPAIIDVQIAPLLVTVQPLPAGSVVEPLALLVQPGGDLIVADGGQQDAPVPGNLIRIDRTNAAAWVAAPLLGPALGPQNPLVQPTAIVASDADHLYALDVGLKAYLPQLDPVLAGNPFLRQLAEPAVVYGVDLTTAPPTVTRVTETRQLVTPADMVFDGITLLICDRGEYADPAVAGPLLRVWRSTHHEFGVVIHFSALRTPLPQERAQIIHSIHEIIDTESPAQTTWTMVFGV